MRYTLEVARISLMLAADPIAEHLVDRDVLIVAALVHDLGKALEYEAGMYGTTMSPLERLVGYKFTGFGILWVPLHSVQGIGECQRLALLNCLSCSHQGAAGGGAVRRAWKCRSCTTPTGFRHRAICLAPPWSQAAAIQVLAFVMTISVKRLTTSSRVHR